MKVNDANGDSYSTMDVELENKTEMRDDLTPLKSVGKRKMHRVQSQEILASPWPLELTNNYREIDEKITAQEPLQCQGESSGGLRKNNSFFNLVSLKHSDSWQNLQSLANDLQSEKVTQYRKQYRSFRNGYAKVRMHFDLASVSLLKSPLHALLSYRAPKANLQNSSTILKLCQMIIFQGEFCAFPSFSTL